MNALQYNLHARDPSLKSIFIRQARFHFHPSNSTWHVEVDRDVKNASILIQFISIIRGFIRLNWLTTSKCRLACQPLILQVCTNVNAWEIIASLRKLFGVHSIVYIHLNSIFLGRNICWTFSMRNMMLSLWEAANEYLLSSRPHVQNLKFKATSNVFWDGSP